MQHKTILGIDPGTKEMGLVVLRGRDLRYFGVHTLRNGTRPHDVIGQARRIVLATIQQHEPDIVAIEEPFNLPTKRSNLLNVIASELQESNPMRSASLHEVLGERWSIRSLEVRSLKLADVRLTPGVPDAARFNGS